jgi:flagellar motility protein MotE (MotC chaperone)
MSTDGYKQFFKKAKDAQQDRVSFRLEQIEKNEQSEQRLRQAMNVKPKKRKAPFPWKALIGLGLSLAGAALYLAAPEKLEALADRIEIHAFGAAKAADGKSAEKSKDPKAKAEKTAAEPAGAEAGKGPEEKASVSSDVSHFEKLRQRKEELDRREKELVELEEELQRQKVELDKRISQLEEMRSQIAQILKDRVDVDQEKVNKLVELYSNMKPKQAADVIGSINEDLAVEILAKMKKKNAAEIMNLLPPDKSKVLSEKYTGYRRNHSEPKG